MSWLKNKLRIWLDIEKDLIQANKILVKKYIYQQNKIDELEECLKNISELSNLNKNSINSIRKVQDSDHSLLESTSKAMNDVYQTVESVVSLGANVHPNAQYDKSWAVVCVEGKMNIVKFLPLNHRDARSMLDYLRSFPTSKSVYDTPSIWEGFDW